MFPEVVLKRRLRKKICRNCGAINAWTADKCRKCKSKDLRPRKIIKKRGK